MTASAVANKPKRYSPMAYNKATIRRRLMETTNRFKRARVEEVEEALKQALQCMLSEGLLPFTDPDIR